jgi:hypothetical protein
MVISIHEIMDAMCLLCLGQELTWSLPLPVQGGDKGWEELLRAGGGAAWPGAPQPPAEGGRPGSLATAPGPQPHAGLHWLRDATPPIP